MKTKNNYLRVIIIFLVFSYIFFFSCANKNPNLSEKQLQELIRSSSQPQTINHPDTISEKTDDKPKYMDSDDLPRNTNNADADGNPKSKYTDEYGRLIAWEYKHMDVKPLFNGKNALEELKKYFHENNNFKKISEENNIQEEAVVVFTFAIDTNGSVVDVVIYDENTTHQAAANEVLRLLNTMHEHGEWTPGKLDGNVLKTIFPSAYRFSNAKQ